MSKLLFCHDQSTGQYWASIQSLSDKALLGEALSETPEVAEQLIREAGGLEALLRGEPDPEAWNVLGGNKVKLRRLAAAMELGRRTMMKRGDRPKFSQPEAVGHHFGPLLANLQHEEFHVACLDVRNRLIDPNTMISKGGYAGCAILPREIFAPALRLAASGIILVHNHPSGDPTPSAEDMELTHRVKSGGDTLGIKVLDHVIIAKGAAPLSFVKLGRM